MKKVKWLLLAAFVPVFFSCSNEDNVFGDVDTGDIPSDAVATVSPEIDEITTSIPNISWTIEDESFGKVVHVEMTGIQEATTTGGWLKLVGTSLEGQNIWITVDGKPKGFVVYNNEEDNRSTMADLVFLVDNSGSMSQEANAVARDIIDWSNSLAAAGLDIKFGCVGYGYYVGDNGFTSLVENQGVVGALDLTSKEILNDYLNERGYTGVERTFGYYGGNADELQTAAKKYSMSGGECGVQALRFADENFKFRTGANRVYVNFTDDYNFPGNSEEISVNYVSDPEKWTSKKGTVHTVFSNDTTYFYAQKTLVKEKPWLISDYTGGTKMFVNSSFSGVTLDSLPVTGALTHSYIIRFTNISDLLDGQVHIVKITIYSEDGLTKAEKIFYITFG